MPLNSDIPSWAPKVSKDKIKRLYVSDSQGILDEELIDEVGWALWSRCDSILRVTAAHYGRVICPDCGAVIGRDAANNDLAGDVSSSWHDDDILACEKCGWHLLWNKYHQTYRGKQLFGANAIEFFENYHKSFPLTSDPAAKMVLIDQLIHTFHIGLTEYGRPVGANLIQGSLKEVIFFLDELTNGPASAAGVGNSREEWRRTIENISWAQQFLKPKKDGTAKQTD